MGFIKRKIKRTSTQIGEIILKQPNWKRWGVFVVVLVLGVLLWGGVAKVQAADGLEITSITSGFFYLIIKIALYLGKFFMQAAIFFLQFFIALAQYNDFINSPTVQVGWYMVRDVANMFFVVVLLAIAIGTILGIENYQWNKTLVKFIFAAIFINFSNLICGIIIDIAHVFTITFVNAVSATAGGNLISMFKMEEMYTIINNKPAEGGEIEGDLFIGAFISMIFALLTALVMGAYLIIMLGRMVALWVLIILSPLAFIMQVIPQTQSFAKKWWTNFGNYVFVAPVIVFFLWLSFATLGSGNVLDHVAADFGSDSLSEIASTSNSSGASLSISAVSTWKNMASFLIPLGLLAVGIKTVQGMGVIGGDLAGGALNMATKFAKAASGLGLAMGVAKGGAGLLKKGAKGAVKGLYKQVPFVGGDALKRAGKAINRKRQTMPYFRKIPIIGGYGALRNEKLNEEAEKVSTKTRDNIKNTIGREENLTIGDKVGNAVSRMTGGDGKDKSGVIGWGKKHIGRKKYALEAEEAEITEEKQKARETRANTASAKLSGEANVVVDIVNSSSDAEINAEVAGIRQSSVVSEDDYAGTEEGEKLAGDVTKAEAEYNKQLNDHYGDAMPDFETWHGEELEKIDAEGTAVNQAIHNDDSLSAEQKKEQKAAKREEFAEKRKEVENSGPESEAFVGFVQAKFEETEKGKAAAAVRVTALEKQTEGFEEFRSEKELSNVTFDDSSVVGVGNYLETPEGEEHAQAVAQVEADYDKELASFVSGTSSNSAEEKVAQIQENRKDKQKKVKAIKKKKLSKEEEAEEIKVVIAQAEDEEARIKSTSDDQWAIDKFEASPEGQAAAATRETARESALKKQAEDEQEWKQTRGRRFGDYVIGSSVIKGFKEEAEKGEESDYDAWRKKQYDQSEEGLGYAAAVSTTDDAYSIGLDSYAKNDITLDDFEAYKEDKIKRLESGRDLEVKKVTEEIDAKVSNGDLSAEEGKKAIKAKTIEIGKKLEVDKRGVDSEDGGIWAKASFEATASGQKVTAEKAEALKAQEAGFGKWKKGDGETVASLETYRARSESESVADRINDSVKGSVVEEDARREGVARTEFLTSEDRGKQLAENQITRVNTMADNIAKGDFSDIPEGKKKEEFKKMTPAHRQAVAERMRRARNEKKLEESSSKKEAADAQLGASMDSSFFGQYKTMLTNVNNQLAQTAKDVSEGFKNNDISRQLEKAAKLIEAKIKKGADSLSESVVMSKQNAYVQAMEKQEKLILVKEEMTINQTTAAEKAKAFAVENPNQGVSTPATALVPIAERMTSSLRTFESTDAAAFATEQIAHLLMEKKTKGKISTHQRAFMFGTAMHIGKQGWFDDVLTESARKINQVKNGEITDTKEVAKYRNLERQLIKVGALEAPGEDGVVKKISSRATAAGIQNIMTVGGDVDLISDHGNVEKKMKEAKEKGSTTVGEGGTQQVISSGDSYNQVLEKMGKAGALISGSADSFKKRLDESAEFLQEASSHFKREAINVGHQEYGANQQFDVDMGRHRMATGTEASDFFAGEARKFKNKSQWQYHGLGTADVEAGRLLKVDSVALNNQLEEVTSAAGARLIPERTQDALAGYKFGVKGKIDDKGRSIIGQSEENIIEGWGSVGGYLKNKLLPELVGNAEGMKYALREKFDNATKINSDRGLAPLSVAGARDISGDRYSEFLQAFLDKAGRYGLQINDEDKKVIQAAIVTSKSKERDLHKGNDDDAAIDEQERAEQPV